VLPDVPDPLVAPEVPDPPAVAPPLPASGPALPFDDDGAYGSVPSTSPLFFELVPDTGALTGDTGGASIATRRPPGEHAGAPTRIPMSSNL
jgi:hypothetical protein